MTFEETIFGMTIAGLVVLVYGVCRNQCIFRFRQRVLFTEGGDAWDRLPSYDYMMFHFWVWPLERFREIPQTQERREDDNQ